MITRQRLVSSLPQATLHTNKVARWTGARSLHAQGIRFIYCTSKVMPVACPPGPLSPCLLEGPSMNE